MNFSNYRFFNILNNFIKDFYKTIIIIKISLLINFINHISKFYKIFDK